MSMKKVVDCVFVSIPYTDTTQPLMAPAILKSIATKAGKTSTTIDFNAEFVNFLNDQSDEDRYGLLSFFRHEEWVNERTLNICMELIQSMAETILEYEPKFVGISVFTYNCQVCSKYLSWMLKKINPKVKIIIGGSGATQDYGTEFSLPTLKKNKLIDLWVHGDSEKTLYHYLTTGSKYYIGINSTDSWLPLTNDELAHLPIPDYSNYDFSQYHQPVFLPILGSRGCVRQCTFCDIHTHWSKFRWRTGKDIVDEMIEFANTYNIRAFHFGDSLVNGNLKEYRSMVKLIAEYNVDKPIEQQLSWSGFFIFRPKEHFTEEDWRLTSEGGADLLVVGIESIDDQVRADIGKKFTLDDMDFSFRMAQKYPGFQFNLLFLTGYPGETDATYDFHEKYWKEATKYHDVIHSVNSGSTLGVLKNTPLNDNFEKLGMKWIGKDGQSWILEDNTPEKRVEWNERMIRALEDNGFKILNGFDAHYIIERSRRNAKVRNSFDKGADIKGSHLIDSVDLARRKQQIFSSRKKYHG